MTLIGETVKIYWNFNRKCWSIQHKGKVKMHATSFIIQNCTFPVSQSGRQRVLLEKRKNVHAFAKGTLVSYEGVCLQSRTFAYYLTPLGVEENLLTDIHYNPYKYSYFYVSRGNTPEEKVEKSDICRGLINSFAAGNYPRLSALNPT